MHQASGEVHLAGSKALDGTSRGFASATPASHVILYGSYLQSPSVSSFYEGGVGTYARLNAPSVPSVLLFEATVGWGRGSIHAEKVEAGNDLGRTPLILFVPFLAFGSPPAPYRITGYVERQSVQLALGGLHPFEAAPVSLQVGVGARTSRITFSNLRSTGAEIAQRGQTYVLEPNLRGRLDFGGFGIEASGGVSIPLSRFEDRNPDVSPLRNVHIAAGVYVDPVRLVASNDG